MADARRYEEWYHRPGRSSWIKPTSLRAWSIPTTAPFINGSNKARRASGWSLNAGQSMGESVMAAADILVDFEGDHQAHVGWSQPGWTALYAPSRFWHIVHGVAGSDRLDRVLELSRARRAGWMYTTDQAAGVAPGDGYLYDRLPRLDHWHQFRHGLGTSG